MQIPIPPTYRSSPLPRSELEERILKELCRKWSCLNHSHFQDSLKPGFLHTWSRLPQQGLWRRDQRIIHIDANFAGTQPWGLVLDELARQMVHQFVDEVRGLTSEPAHTAAYLRECDQRGLGSGIGWREALSEEDQRALRRVMQLLALAESPNRHESESAMQEAQRLMLRHNLKVAPQVPRLGTDYETRCLGHHKGRFPQADRYLAGTLRDHFFVRTFWRWFYDPRNQKKGWMLEISGTPTNLEMASYVYDFMRRTGERLWQEHKQQRDLRGDRDRRSYLAGIVQGFHTKLAAQQKKNQAEGLVWLGDKKLEDFHDRRYPERRVIQLKQEPWNEARKQGYADGQKIVLPMPVEGGRHQETRPLQDSPTRSLPAG